MMSSDIKPIMRDTTSSWSKFIFVGFLRQFLTKMREQLTKMRENFN